MTATTTATTTAKTTTTATTATTATAPARELPPPPIYFEAGCRGYVYKSALTSRPKTGPPG